MLPASRYTCVRLWGRVGQRNGLALCDVPPPGRQFR